MDKGPIFFIGEGRSGTTIIFEAFSKHKNIAYLSNYTDKFYFPQVGLMHRIINRQGMKNQYKDASILNKFYPTPSEAYGTWKKLCGEKMGENFMRNAVPTYSEAEKVRNYVKRTIQYQGKETFSTKFTGPPRITYLSNIFSDASFINIIRDPRAVVASLLKVGFWIEKGNTPFWEDTFTEKEYSIWEKYNFSPVALAALELSTIYDQTKKESKKSGRYAYTIKYEDFINNPLNEIEELLDYLKLEHCDSVMKYVKNTNYRNMNSKYKERLSNDEIQMVKTICEQVMDEQGYV